MKINSEKLKDSDYIEFTRELESSKVMYGLANKFDENFLNGHQSIGVISIAGLDTQNDLIMSVLNILTRKHSSRKINAIFLDEALCLSDLPTVRKNEYFETLGYHRKSVCSTLVYQGDSEHGEKEDSFRDKINSFTQVYNQLIYSLPNILKIRNKLDIYASILDQITSVFLVVPTKGIKKKELLIVQEYLKNFDIKIEGLIMEEMIQTRDI